MVYSDKKSVTELCRKYIVSLEGKKVNLDENDFRNMLYKSDSQKAALVEGGTLEEALVALRKDMSEMCMDRVSAVLFQMVKHGNAEVSMADLKGLQSLITELGDGVDVVWGYASAKDDGSNVELLALFGFSR